VVHLSALKAKSSVKKLEAAAAVKERVFGKSIEVQNKMEEQQKKLEAVKAQLNKGGAPVSFDQVIASSQQMLLDNQHTCFAELGRVPIEFTKPMPQQNTAAIVLVLPGGVGTKVAKAAAKTKVESEARCCVRACQILGEANLMESEIVKDLVQDLDKAVNDAKIVLDAGLTPLQLPSVGFTKRARPKAKPKGPIQLLTEEDQEEDDWTQGWDGGWKTFSVATVESIAVALCRIDRHPPKQVLALTRIWGLNKPVPLQCEWKASIGQYVASLEMPHLDCLAFGGVTVTGEDKRRKEAERLCMEVALETLKNSIPPM